MLSILIGIPPSVAQDAKPIPVVNAGFEDNQLPGGSDRAVRGSMNGWDLSGVGGAIHLDFKRISRVIFPGDRSETDGKACAWLDRGHLLQRTGEQVEPGARYTLVVSVGQRQDLGPGQYAIELLGGETVLVSENRPLPNAGSFVRATASVQVDRDHPAVGQPLSIRLSITGGRQVSFDRVTLVKTLPLPLAEKVRRTVEQRVQAWAQKGKFEKSEDHARRVTDATTAAARDSLTTVVLGELAKAEIDWTSAQNRYDADREVFTILIDGIEPFDVPVPIEEAEAFDANFRSLRYENPVFELADGNLRIVSVEVSLPGAPATYRGR